MMQVLRRRGRLFASSKGSAETYKLSSTVTKISVFLSHNWVVPRYKKFVALSLHFNFDLAFGITLSIVACMALAGALGGLPAWDEKTLGEYPCIVFC